jgi:hypothetical protein
VLVGRAMGGLAPDGDGDAKRPNSVGWRREATKSDTTRRGPLVLGCHTIGIRLGVS